jgi:hypothetical protein
MLIFFQIPNKIYLIRGIVGFIAVDEILSLSQINSTASGLLSVFPVKSLTNLTFLWLSGNASVGIGAIGPMILGSVSPSLFCFLMGALLASFSLWQCILIAFAISIFGYSVPIGAILFLWKRKLRNNQIAVVRFEPE